MLGALPGGEMLAGATRGEAFADEDDEDAVEDVFPEFREAAAGEEGVEGIGAATEEVGDQKSEVGEDGKPKTEDGAEEEVGGQKSEVGKELAELKGQLEAITKERDELKATRGETRPTPTPENPLADVLDRETLAAHANFAQELEDWCIDHNHTGGTMPARLDAIITGRTLEEVKAEPREFSTEQTQAMRKNARQRLVRDIPARQQWLQHDAQALNYVRTHYPDALKPETETGKLYARFEREFPAIKALPTWRVALLDCVRGAQQRIAEEAKRTTGPQGKTAETTPAEVKPSSKGQDVPLAPRPPGKPGGAPPKTGGANGKPRPQLSASMNAEELAAIL